jgi:hypothetical protein
MSRPERVAQFRRQASGGWFETSLLASGHHRDCDAAAITNWHLRAPIARPACFPCQTVFSPPINPAAFLTARASRAPNGGVAVAALCAICWSKTPDAVEAAALSLLRRQLGNGAGRFLE